MRRSRFRQCLLAAILFAPAVLAAALWVRSEHASDTWETQLWRPEAGRAIVLHAWSSFGRAGIWCESTHMRPAAFDEWAISHAAGSHFRTFVHAAASANEPAERTFNATLLRLTDARVYHRGPTGASPSLARPAVLAGMTSETWGMVVPDWIPLLLTMAAAAFLLHRLLRCWLRAARGRCMACGYDLRCSPARCPECGRVSSLQTPSSLAGPC